MCKVFFNLPKVNFFLKIFYTSNEFPATKGLMILLWNQFTEWERERKRQITAKMKDIRTYLKQYVSDSLKYFPKSFPMQTVCNESKRKENIKNLKQNKKNNKVKCACVICNREFTQKTILKCLKCRCKKK